MTEKNFDPRLETVYWVLLAGDNEGVAAFRTKAEACAHIEKEGYKDPSKVVVIKGRQLDIQMSGVVITERRAPKK